ncbi:oligosaccharyl transferase glycoprotein complex, beta subunit [Agyrium rufum]|nr:oligosaccharyl transferase glycoprotein complex, beta subunit [Agyrium rufum]
MRWISSLGLALFASCVAAVSSSGSRLLVVLEDAAEKAKYDLLWGDLTKRGYSISFESPKADKLSLLKYGELQYNHLFLLPPKSRGLGSSLTPKTILEFTKNGGNVLVALSGESGTPAAISSLLLEVDIQLPPEKTSQVVDHFSYDVASSSENHDVLLTGAPTFHSDLKNYFTGLDILAFPRAVGQELGNASPLLAPIIRAGSTAYTYNPKDDADVVEEPFAVGDQITLVSALQARNSARLTVIGSSEALEDTWFNAKVQTVKGETKKTSNRKFSQQLTSWTFKETGVLKVGKVEHHLSSLPTKENGNTSITQVGFLNPTIYRIKNDVTFNIEISEYTTTHYSPLTIPAPDALQLEFTMLSPFHRLPLHPIRTTPNSSIFSTTFTLPDQHGIFSFRVNYKRPFLTNLDVKREVTVRHFAHDEYPRSWMISGGWVWIAGIWVTVLGWLGFVAVWLYSEPAFEDGKKGKKTQ